MRGDSNDAGTLAARIAGERAAYVSVYRHEVFIVPLLAERIQHALDTFGKPRHAEGKVLDVGCGAQPLRKTLTAMGYRYHAIDTQQSPDGSVDFVCPIDGELPAGLIARGPFDLLVCTEVLEHVADWNAAFGNFRKLLAPGGRILITCPHMYPLHEEPYDFWRPTPHSLKYFANRFGLTVLHQECAGTGWDVVGTVIASIRPKPYRDSRWGRFLAFLVYGFCRVCWKILSWRILQRMAKAEPVYISNVAVFEAPSAGAA